MRRLTLVLALVAALVGAAQALAVGPWLWTVNGGPGIAAGGDTRFVARLAGGSTRLVELRGGKAGRSVEITGRWGFQAATIGGALAGVSGDGRTLVLSGPTRMEPLAETPFTVVSTRDLKSRAITVRGNMTIDALSPDGRLLYLIQHVAARGQSRYQVRAYDLRANRLLPRVIADKRQKGWLMTGMPVARAVEPRGAMVYTLYQSDGNYPFVHALDTVRATALCIGLPLAWTDPAVLDGATMRLTGNRLLVSGPNTGGTVAIDTRTGQVVSGA